MAERPMWEPSSERVADANITRFRGWLAERGLAEVDGYEALHGWSVRHSGEFWRAVWDFCGVRGAPGERLVERPEAMPGARFLPDATLNIAENLLRLDGDAPAVLEAGEDGRRRTTSWDELREQAGRMASALRAAGVEEGDRVAAWLPNCRETLVTMLGATWIGATFSSTSPDFGVDGVIDRFGQIEPTVLVAADGYHYAGRDRDCLERLAAIEERLPSVRRTVLVSFLDDAAVHPGAVGWDDFLGGAPQAPPFVSVPADHPWYVLYSSGTTGAPKCIVHRSAGVLLKHLVEHVLHGDVRPGDRVFYFTTAGWMMWNWLMSGLAAGATLVLYDGSPLHPGPEALFDLVAESEATLMGVSAKFIDAVGQAGIRPAETHDLSALRTICSTGSPLIPEGFAVVYDRIRADVHLASISGGTDLVGCLVAGDPTGPVWGGEIQRPGLGMGIDVLDDHGRPLTSGKGELVCTGPFPSMPLGFWDDPDDERYRAAYFDRFDGVWRQGDFAEWTDHGGIVIHGRADATLNPGGVRIGTAEIYRVVERVEGVAEGIVIGQEVGGDTRVVLFVVLEPGLVLDDELEDRIRAAVRWGASPRHVPSVIAQVPEIPRTRSGKIVELAVRAVVHGDEPENLEALANPEALDHFRDRPEVGPDGRTTASGR